MKYINNKSGFTLVELLAVIVILALIMGIAAFSMSGVISNVQINSFKTSATYFIDGTRKLMLANMELDEGYYYVSSSKLERKANSPWGEYVYYTGADTTISNGLVNKGYARTSGELVCGGTGSTGSFIRIIKAADGNYDYEICLYDNQNNYVYANETVLVSDSSSQDDFFRTDVTAPLTLENGKIK